MSRITLKDVAARAGVSYQTVSKVLNRQARVTEETEKRVWQAASDLKYTPNVAARSLRTRASKLIGCAWYPSSHVTWRPILTRFLYSIIDAAEAQGYLITFFTGKSEDLVSMIATYGDLFARNQVDGFMLAETAVDDPRVAYLIEQDIPFTAFGQANSDWDFCWVDVDSLHGILSVMAHLRERGHRRIGFISWPEASKTGQHRERGYRAGMAISGVDIDPDWIFYSKDSVETGVKGLEHFISLPQERRPTAVVCVSDQIAVGAMNAATAAGLRVGEDIAITGYDDVLMAKFLHPPLTTVAQPIEEVGQMAIDLLLKQVRGEQIEQKENMFKPELIIREST